METKQIEDHCEDGRDLEGGGSCVCGGRKGTKVERVRVKKCGGEEEIEDSVL